jgi:solute carrier family 9B (sodium/hydrogen exchanger), member 1/2
VLFSMLGAEVDVRLAWQAGLVGGVNIFAGVIGRTIGVWGCLLGSQLTERERLFVAVAFS